MDKRWLWATGDKRWLWAAGAAVAGLLLWRSRGALADITPQINAARGMSAPTARRYLRQEAKRLRHAVIPGVRQDARDLDDRARDWRAAQGRAGGAARGNKVQAWWAQMRQAAQDGDIRVPVINPYGADDVEDGEPDALLCAVRTIARPGGVLAGRKMAPFRKRMTDRAPAEWAAQLLSENPEIYRDCQKKAWDEQVAPENLPQESEAAWRARQESAVGW